MQNNSLLNMDFSEWNFFLTDFQFNVRVFGAAYASLWIEWGVFCQSEGYIEPQYWEEVGNEL
jgi:hypothetical protein